MCLQELTRNSVGAELGPLVTDTVSEAFCHSFGLTQSDIYIVAFTVCLLIITVTITHWEILLPSDDSEQKAKLFAIGFQEFPFKTLLRQSWSDPGTQSKCTQL